MIFCTHVVYLSLFKSICDIFQISKFINLYVFYLQISSIALQRESHYLKDIIWTESTNRSYSIIYSIIYSIRKSWTARVNIHAQLPVAWCSTEKLCWFHGNTTLLTGLRDAPLFIQLDKIVNTRSRPRQRKRRDLTKQVEGEHVPKD